MSTTISTSMSRLHFLLLLGLSLTRTPAVRAEATTVTVLATTDLHGNLLPYDYYTARKATRGLAQIATLVRQVRREAPHVLLVDCGDTIQGTPLESVYQDAVRSGSATSGGVRVGDPMMRAMNAMGYDAMAVGNHEYNFGLANLQAARKTAHFPWLSANTRTLPGAAVQPFAPYVVKQAGPVRVALIGVTTPSIPAWEKPENYRGYEFESPVAAVRRTVETLRTGKLADVVIVLSHSGLDRDLRSGVANQGALPGENAAYQIATEVEGLDALLFGHTHLQLAPVIIGRVLTAQAKNWGVSLARLDIRLTREGDGPWRVVERTGTLLPVQDQTPVDSEIEQIALPYHQATERVLSTVVAQSPLRLDARLGRVEDSALLDAVQTVQLHYAQADVSFASVLNAQASIAPGPVTQRQVAALYIYENELYALQGNGRMVREALENSARSFMGCEDAACATVRLDPQVPGYNTDLAQGVTYRIDLTKPAGQRIVDLRWKGQPLRDDKPLRLAVNNYRAGGSGGYTMFRNAPVLWRSGREIRELIAEYYRERKELPSQPDHNWRIIPAAAEARLRQQAEQARPGTQ